MKKTGLFPALAALLLLADTCEKDNYEAPNASIHGSFIDEKTGELVEQDILENPQDYEIEKPDANIGFRRVRNLRVYFSHTAIPLTTDIYDIGQWQGGDIVIFEKHIGIVSDKRNDDGVAYVIHHSGGPQASYEEDILEKRDDIVGHYRVSE